MSSAATTSRNPVTTQVVRHALETIAEEMRTSLHRTALTVVVKDMLDFSCALFDRHGRLIAVGVDIPSLLASMGSGLTAVLEKWGDRIYPGDVLMTNDPFGGAAHTPDLHIFVPVFDDSERLIGYSGTIAHHGDWGGRVPGTVSSANGTIFEEGVVYPGVKLEERGVRNEAIYEVLAANVRQPELNLGDLRAQLAAAHTGERGLRRLAQRYGTDGLLELIDDLLDYARERTRQEIAALPDGTYEAEGFLDDDGKLRGVPRRIHARVTIAGDRITFDLTGCSEQTSGGMNCPFATTRSAVHYALKCITSPDIPFNEGCVERVEIIVNEHSLVNPSRPAATSDRHLASERLSDVLTRAVGQAAPERASAGWFCGWPFITCEATSPKTGLSAVLLANIGAGAGATYDHDGADGLDVHSANCALIPAETIEMNYPLRVDGYVMVPDSGGPGKYRGGLGFSAAYRVLGEEPIVIQSEVEQSLPEFAPPGLAGGKSGGISSISLIREGEEIPQDPKGVFEARPGDVVMLRAGGGGGYGDPREREPALLAADLRSGRVTSAAVRTEYGLDHADALVGPDDASELGRDTEEE